MSPSRMRENIPDRRGRSDVSAIHYMYRDEKQHLFSNSRIRTQTHSSRMQRGPQARGPTSGFLRVTVSPCAVSRAERGRRGEGMQRGAPRGWVRANETTTRTPRSISDNLLHHRSPAELKNTPGGPKRHVHISDPPSPFLFILAQLVRPCMLIVYIYSFFSE